MPDIKIIALDLDGTLLSSDKKLPPGNLAALQRAARAGMEIVPSTGRFYGGMPEVIRRLPFVRFAITVNGAAVYDVKNAINIASANIPIQRAVEIMSYLDTLPVIYDCYMDNSGWMTRAHWEQAEVFAPDAHYLKMIRELRTPVPDLKAYLLETGRNVQKIQLFANDLSLRQALLASLPKRYPQAAISTSVVNNIEINDLHANKGEALGQLAAYLGCDITRTMAFGDGLNDLSLIQSAGIGVAMANACPEVLAAAGYITTDCDHDGIAEGLQRFCARISCRDEARQTIMERRYLI
ncbi:MAG: HAD family hydrolase [Oscillospiraceae bacterium]|nr:HAD family hydrolase [Oscillospiraceae bacterium]